MVPHLVKAAYYVLSSPLMRANGGLYRLFRAPRSGTVRVHLGPGRSKYLPGWINVDANIVTAKCDVWADLRNPLPFPDRTVDAFYSHHVVEHLPDLVFHFREVHRCLKPGGLYRVGGPHGDNAIDRFIANDCDWFGEFPDSYKSIGGRFVNFVFCRREHLTLLTRSYLEELLTDAGFESITVCTPMLETSDDKLIDRALLAMEDQPNGALPHTLIVEARKTPEGCAS